MYETLFAIGGETNKIEEVVREFRTSPYCATFNMVFPKENYAIFYHMETIAALDENLDEDWDVLIKLAEERNLSWYEIIIEDGNEDHLAFEAVTDGWEDTTLLETFYIKRTIEINGN